MPPHLWLIGMMGAGKTSAGRQLATRLEVPFVDSDDVVAVAAGLTIAELWEKEGENVFRDLEAAAVSAIADRPGRCVAAVGGGAVLRPDNVTAMGGSGTVVWLTAPAATLAGRTGPSDRRPLLAGGDHRERLDAILAERRTLYEAAADRVVDTAGRPVVAVVDDLVAVWRTM